MRLGKVNLYLGMACFFIVLCFSVQGYSAEANGSVLAKKTLTRWVDPIVMAGSVAKEVTGTPLSNVRLYAFRDGVFKPILFQIDEMTGENGDWILPSGNIPNTELSNGKFDTWDKLLFMADDTGDRVSREGWVKGFTKGAEVEVIDPVNGGKGWVYLLSFASNPPPLSSEPNYVRWDYATEIFESDYCETHSVVTEDGRHISSYDKVLVTKKAGGNGENFVDILKIRVKIKALFNAISLTFKEDTIKCDTLAYKCGPIRLLKRFEDYVYIPGGYKAFRIVADCGYCRNTTTVPFLINIPFKMGTVLSSFIIRMGTEYNPSVIGSRIYNSNNPQGCLVDGKMSDCEKKWNSEPDKWRLITGDFGTYMTRTILPAGGFMEHVKLTTGILDDINYKDPPETYPGSIGFLYQDWELKDVPGGKYIMYLEWYYPAHYKPEVVAQYTDMLDNLLKIQGGSQEEKNQLLLAANLGEKYKSIRVKKRAK